MTYAGPDFKSAVNAVRLGGGLHTKRRFINRCTAGDFAAFDLPAGKLILDTAV
jgi:hypothetical protein